MITFVFRSATALEFGFEGILARRGASLESIDALDSSMKNILVAEAMERKGEIVVWGSPFSRNLVE